MRSRLRLKAQQSAVHPQIVASDVAGRDPGCRREKELAGDG